MGNYERWQQLLLKIRDHRCGGNATELARRIHKDASYVHRLFWPADKKGAKGIGPEMQQACNEAFSLPRGYWDLQPEEAFAGEISAHGSTLTSATANLSAAAPAREADTTLAMRILFEGMAKLQGFELSEAQNAVRYALESPADWQAAALTLERLLGGSNSQGAGGRSVADQLRSRFPKRPALVPIPTDKSASEEADGGT